MTYPSALSTLQTSLPWEILRVKCAGAGVGGTPKGRSGNCEQTDNCPASHLPETRFPRVQGTNTADGFLLRAQSSAYTWKYKRYTHSGRSLAEKKRVFRNQFSQKSPRALQVLNHGWWRLAVGAWQLAVGGGWWRLVVGDWWLVAVGSGWQLAVGRRWRLAAVGGWQLVVGG